MEFTVTLQDFEAAVNAHDLTYAFSDDHRVWRRGEESSTRITALKNALGPAQVGACAQIWNAMVERSLRPGEYRDSCLWNA